MKRNMKVGKIESLKNSKLTKEQMSKANGGFGSFYYIDDWCGTKPKPFPWPPIKFNNFNDFVINY